MAGTSTGINQNQIIRTGESEGRSTAQCTGAENRNLMLTSMTKTTIKMLGLVLMAVKSQTKAPINQVLKNIWVHVIRLHWDAFGIMVPYRDSDTVLECGLT